MGFAESLRILTGINCGLQSLCSYMDDRNNGQTPQVATAGFVGNMLNGLARNEVAYEMQKNGFSGGNIINGAYGYGSQAANAAGTLGLMSVYTPWMFFNSPCNFSYTVNYGGFGSPFGYLC